MIITGGLLALPNGAEPVLADIRIAGGLISKIVRSGRDAAEPADGEIVDARGMLVLPGAVDPHVHLDPPDYLCSEPQP